MSGMHVQVVSDDALVGVLLHNVFATIQPPNAPLKVTTRGSTHVKVVIVLLDAAGNQARHTSALVGWVSYPCPLQLLGVSGGSPLFNTLIEFIPKIIAMFGNATGLLNVALCAFPPTDSFIETNRVVGANQTFTLGL